MRVGINGYGRMGRLALRAALQRGVDLQFVAVNEPTGSTETLAVLTEFDSVQGRAQFACSAASDDVLVTGDHRLRRTRVRSPAEVDWAGAGVELVLECSGRYRTVDALQPHFERGAERVLVSAPVKGGAPNLVVGVNDAGVDFQAERIVSAASCTTNCLAPVARVMHDAIGIARGLVTTIHDPTNTQSVLDAPHEDPRRARASSVNLVPTSTNSATAVTGIVTELAGKLDTIAVRAPVLNSSLIDCAFQMERDTSVEEVNQVLARAAASEPLQGILGYETRPLVSTDFAGDPRSAVVDALSTRVVDGSLVKVLAWYDNEWGYANRMVDLALRFAAVAG